MKLRTRFVLVTAAVAVAVALATTPLLVRRTAADLRAAEDRKLQDVALAATGPLVTLSNREVLLVVVSSFSGGGDVGVTVRRGAEVVVSVGPVPSSLPAIGPPPVEGGFVTVEDVTTRWRVLTVAAPETLRLAEGAADAVQFSSSLDAVERTIADRRRATWLVSIAVVLATTLAAAVVAGFATRPLARLREAAASIGAGARRPMPERQGVEEVDALAGTVNDLLARLDAEHARTLAALDASRSFTANAAHELRTPLTSMRANVEVLEAYPDLPAGERAEVVAAIAAEGARAQRLLAALRDLARGELLDPTGFEPVDVGEVLDAAVAGAARLHPAAVIEVRHEGQVVVRGAPEGLRLAVDNLVLNACVHGQGGRRQVRVVAAAVRQGDRVVVTVDDDGPGIPAGDEQRVFERFARSTTTAEGSGLGLALVAQQARLHGGGVRAERSPAGGARLVLELPAADGASHDALTIATDQPVGPRRG